MKLLIKKDLMTSNVKIWHMFVLISLIYLASFKASIIDDNFVPVLYGLLMFAPMIYFVNLSNYTEIDGYKSEIMLPIKKHNVVLARYVTYFLIVLINWIPMASLLFLKFFLGIIPFDEQIISQTFFGASLVLILGGLLLLSLFIFGHDKIKALTILCGICTILLGSLILQVVVMLFNLGDIIETYEFTYIFLSLFVAATVFYIISCIGSVMIFNNREF